MFKLIENLIVAVDTWVAQKQLDRARARYDKAIANHNTDPS